MRPRATTGGPGGRRDVYLVYCCTKLSQCYYLAEWLRRATPSTPSICDGAGKVYRRRGARSGFLLKNSSTARRLLFEALIHARSVGASSAMSAAPYIFTKLSRSGMIFNITFAMFLWIILL